MVDIHTTFLHLGSESWKRVEAEHCYAEARQELS